MFCLLWSTILTGKMNDVEEGGWNKNKEKKLFSSLKMVIS
jgi:hypothetical protein